LLSSPVVRLGGGYLLLIVDVVAFPLPFAYPPNPWIGFCLLLSFVSYFFAFFLFLYFLKTFFT